MLLDVLTVPSIGRGNEGERGLEERTPSLARNAKVVIIHNIGDVARESSNAAEATNPVTSERSSRRRGWRHSHWSSGE